VSDWILYDQFVDLVRSHHRDAYSGLVTGLCDRQHAFQIGFDEGDIVLLTYRVKKGIDALPFIMQIERAKITDQMAMDISDAVTEKLDTSSILSQLTTDTIDDTTTTEISNVGILERDGKGSERRQIDERLRQAIKTAAVHHFGPIAAMVCEEHLANSEGDLRTVIMNIAQDVGASQDDTETFLQSISEI
jgi:hypothetical protein